VNPTPRLILRPAIHVRLGTVRWVGLGVQGRVFYKRLSDYHGGLQYRGLAASALLYALIHRSAWNRDSRKFTCRILHTHTPIPLEQPSRYTPRSPAPLELVTPVDRYARW
jgi:hypothetical protein